MNFGFDANFDQLCLSLLDIGIFMIRGPADAVGILFSGILIFVGDSSRVT